MTKIVIKDFKEATSIQTPLLLTNMSRGLTNAGAPYLSMTLSDKSGSIEGKMWDVKEEQARLAVVGKVIMVNAEVLKYRSQLQLRIHSIQAIKEGEFELKDFIVTSAISKDQLKEELLNRIRKIENKVLNEIVSEMVNLYPEDFFEYPAATKNHHEFVGGLATHVIGMVKLADSICDLYPALNRDLLISGTILHDYGKLFELSGAVLTEYTLAGKLLGHISIVQTKIEEMATKLGYQNEEIVLLLRHLVLSHHGSLEYGSPVLPQIMEAEVLSIIDNLDARMNMFEKALDPIEAGTYSARVFSLENRIFYKPKF